MYNLNQYLRPLSLGFFLIALLGGQSASAESSVTEFNVDGLKVILKQTPKEIISVSLFVEGGTNNYTKEQEGIEELAFRVATGGGTENLDKKAFHAIAESTGTRISSSTTYDFGTIDMTCVKTHWDQAWNLYTDAILHPAFSADEFELEKEQLLSAIKTSNSDPDDHLRTLAMAGSFEGSSYTRIPSGSESAVEKLTVKDVRSYYEDLIGKQRVFLVIVGDVEISDIRAKIKNTLAGLPEGKPASYEERVLITTPGVTEEDRDIATNYIRGLTSAPTFDTKDGVAMWLAMSILRDRLFLEIRTKRSLSYAPSAAYATGIVKNPYNIIYVTTIDPKQSLEVMVNEIDKIREEGFSAYELKNEQQTVLTQHFMGEQTTSAQAASLGRAELTGGWELAENLTDRLNAVTLEDLNRVAKEYLGTIRWTYLGKEEMMDPGDYPQPKEALKIHKDRH